MTWTHYSRSLAVFLLLTACSLPAGSLLAAPKPRTTPAPVQLALKFKVPPQGAPAATAGGATRGVCGTTQKSLTPLLPQTRLGLTVTERPSFFFHLPEASVQTAEFLLLGNDDQEVVYSKTFSLPTKAGIVRFDLPADAPGLEVGKQYHWYVTLVCDPNRPSGNPSIEGWVERISANSALAKELAKADPARRPAIYAEAGIWHETLRSMVELRQKSQNNARVITDWQELLRSVGLDQFANEPLIN